MSEKTRVYGIDLGTTYSCISYVDEHGKPVVLANAEGDLTTPSVVFFESPDNIVVGNAAKEVAAFHHDRCVSTVKRAMGDSQWERTFFDSVYKPQDISSFILRKLVRDAEQITGEKIEDVVITCPAYFGFNEKEATRQAGELAGLNVRYVIPEPTAAALAYGIEQDDDQVILVYDLGGGTFDVTVIEIRGREITVICTGGDHQLGGKNWDDAIVSYLAERFENETGISADTLLDDPETYQDLLNSAERLKKSLTSRQSVSESVRFEGDRARVDLDRETFDRISSQYLERTLSLAKQEIEKAKGRGHTHIDKLLLVGGSTYMPQVSDCVTQHFAFEVLQFDPNQAVAKGAAIFGYKCYLDEQIKIRIAEETGKSMDEVDLENVDDAVVESAQEEVAREHGLALPGLQNLVNKKITNVTSKSFGVVVVNRNLNKEVVANLILVDEQVPRSNTQEFSTLEDQQIQVDLRCMESTLDEREADVIHCKELGMAVLSFGKPLPQSSPIEVTFKLAADGLLKLHGRDLTTGNEIDAEFETKSILNREEVEAAKNRNMTFNVC